MRGSLRGAEHAFHMNFSKTVALFDGELIAVAGLRDAVWIGGWRLKSSELSERNAPGAQGLHFSANSTLEKLEGQLSLVPFMADSSLLVREQQDPVSENEAKAAWAHSKRPRETVRKLSVNPIV